MKQNSIYLHAMKLYLFSTLDHAKSSIIPENVLFFMVSECGEWVRKGPEKL